MMSNNKKIQRCRSARSYSSRLKSFMRVKCKIKEWMVKLSNAAWFTFFKTFFRWQIVKQREFKLMCNKKVYPPVAYAYLFKETENVLWSHHKLPIIAFFLFSSSSFRLSDSAEQSREKDFWRLSKAFFLELEWVAAGVEGLSDNIEKLHL